MEEKAKICIVEDEVIIADSIRLALQSLGYDVPEPASNFDQAIVMIEKEKPDLALLDIKLKRGKDGIELARHIREHWNIPIIFLTANSDTPTLERAKAVKPNAFLVKPFQKPALYMAIELAICNFTTDGQTALPAPKEEPYLIKDAIFIKDGHYFHKIKFDDVNYLSSEHVYVTIHTAQKKYMVRGTLQEYLEKFDPSKFMRVHQRFAVNIRKIEKFNTAYLLINDEEIPISRSYQAALMTRFNIG